MMKPTPPLFVDKSRSVQIVSAVFILVPLLVAAYFFTSGIFFQAPPWETSAWEQTTGEITGVSVFLDGGMFRTESGRRASFLARVSYQYELDGKSYAGNGGEFTLDPYRERIDQSEAESRAAERFIIGNPVVVFYNPADPAESTLHPGMASDASLNLFLGGACLAISAWMAWTFLRPIKHR